MVARYEKWSGVLRTGKGVQGMVGKLLIEGGYGPAEGCTREVQA